MMSDFSAGPCQANLSTSVNATNILGQTALHDAVTIGYREVVHLLIKHGADVNLVSKAEMHPDHSDGVPSKVPMGAVSSPLETACLQGDLEMLKLLLSNGAQDVEHKCLNSAIMADNIDVITILLQQGKLFRVCFRFALLRSMMLSMIG